MSTWRDLLARTTGYKRRKNFEYRAFRPRETERTPMLNLHRVSIFRFDLKEIMSHYEVEESMARSVMASVIAKGTRVSIDSAKDFVREQVSAGAYPEEASEEICDLLDRWSKLR